MATSILDPLAPVTALQLAVKEVCASAVAANVVGVEVMVIVEIVLENKVVPEGTVALILYW